MRDGSVATPRHQAIYRAMLEEPKLSDKELSSRFDYPSNQRFAADKHQTYMEILAALRQYYYRRHDDLILLDELHLIRVLREKGMYKEAHKRMRTALQKASEMEDLELQLLLERESRSLFYHTTKVSKWESARKATWDRINRTLDLARNHYQYVDLHMRISEIKLIKGAAPADESSQIEKILRHPLMKGERYALSSVAKDTFYTVKRTAADLLGDIDMELQAARAAAIEVLKDPLDPRRSKLSVIATLTLYCRTVTRAPYVLDVFYQQCRDTARSLAASPDYRYIRIAANRYILLTYANDIGWRMRHCLYQELPLMVAEAENAMVQFEDSMTGQTRSSMFLAVGQGHLILGNFDEAIRNFQVLIQEGESVHREDYTHAATMLDLIANFEKGNKRHVEYRCLALKRKFRNKRAPHKTEKTILKFLHKLCNSPEIEGYDRNFWEQLDAELQHLALDHKESPYFKEFHLINHWVRRRSTWTPLKNPAIA